MRCAACGREVPRSSEPEPKSERTYCNEACWVEFMRLHPTEAVGWVQVGDMTLEQRAELDALIGRGVKA